MDGTKYTGVEVTRILSLTVVSIWEHIFGARLEFDI